MWWTWAKQLNKAHSSNGLKKRAKLVGCPQLANKGVSELVNGWEMLADRIPLNVDSWRSPVRAAGNPPGSWRNFWILLPGWIEEDS